MLYVYVIEDGMMMIELNNFFIYVHMDDDLLLRKLFGKIDENL